MTRSDPRPHRHEAININTKMLASNGQRPNDHEAQVNTEDQEKDYDSDYSEVVVMHTTESQGSQTIFDYENVEHNPGIYSIYSEATEYEEAASDKKRASTAAMNANFEFSAHGYENVTYDRDETNVNSGTGVLAEHKVHESKGKTDDKLPPPVTKKRPPVKKKPRRVETSSKSDGNTSSQSVIVPISVYDEVKFEYGAQLESTSVYQNFSDDQQSSHVTRKESNASFSQTQVPKGQNRHHYNNRTITPGPEVTYYNQREMSKENDEASYYNHRALKSRNHNQI